jgi:hypothetical protein
MALQASCCARSSPVSSTKTVGLVFPVLYRSGTPEETRTPAPGTGKYSRVLLLRLDLGLANDLSPSLGLTSNEIAELGG